MQFLRRRLSDGNFLAGGGAGDPPGGGGAGGRPPPSGPAPPLLLVIAPPGTDWVKLFRGKSVHGDVELRVEQAQFSQLSLVASTHGGLSVTIDTPRGGARRFRPDFVLVREAPAGGGASGAPQRLLAGLHMGGVPGTAPLPAARGLGHPPAMFAQLVKLQRELGAEAFPVVPQRFCTRPRGLLAAPTFPMTVTLSPAPPGVGQARVGSPEALGVVAVAMGGNHAGALVTVTPEGTERVRLTRIGGTDRALRWSLAAGEPGGEGPQLEPMALSPRHRAWLDACARLFGGTEICGVEALRGPDGREHILEVLGSWLPLVGPGAAEDRARIVELVLGRMRAELPPPRSPSPSRPRPQQQVLVTSGTPRPGTPPEQRPPPQGAPPAIGPAQPRPPPQGQPRPPGGVSSAGPAPARGPAQQPRPPGPQPRPQTPPTAQPRPSGPQPRPQAPPTAMQPRPPAPPTSPQHRPQAPPTGVQPRPQTPPISPQHRPQAPPTSPQPRPQAPPTGMQPRPQAPPTSPQPRPQAPPTSPQPRPQAPPTGMQPRPQAPPTGMEPRPQAPPTSPQPRPPGSPSQPRPHAPQPRPPGPQAPPTTRQPRPQAPPLAPKPALSPKPGGAAQAPPSPAPSLRQSFASLFE